MSSRLGIGAIILVVLLAVSVTAVCRRPHLVAGRVPKAWFSDGDIEDHEPAPKRAPERVNKDGWERVKPQQPAGGWQGGQRDPDEWQGGRGR
jgi:hypothetical protein